MTETQPELVACPECGKADMLTEYSNRCTWQPVVGLRRDGSAADYSAWDFDGFETVVGYGCKCGWYEVVDGFTEAQEKVFEDHVKRVLAAMPAASADPA